MFNKVASLPQDFQHSKLLQLSSWMTLRKLNKNIDVMVIDMIEGTHKHDLNLKIEKWSSGTYTAQVVEVPSIIVQAETKAQLIDEVKVAFEGYIKAFPDEHNKLFHSQEHIEYEHLNITV